MDDSRDLLLSLCKKRSRGRDLLMGEGEGDHLEGFVLRIAAIAEQSSNHPLSRAILEVSSSIYPPIYLFTLLSI